MVGRSEEERLLNYGNVKVSADAQRLYQEFKRAFVE
jgi:hypothetical protein